MMLLLAVTGFWLYCWLAASVILVLLWVLICRVMDRAALMQAAEARGNPGGGVTLTEAEKRAVAALEDQFGSDEGEAA